MQSRAGRAAGVAILLAVLGAPAPVQPVLRTLWSLRGGVEDFSLRRGHHTLLNNSLHEADGDTPEHSDTVTASPQWGRFATYAALDEADGDTPEHSDTVTASPQWGRFATYAALDEADGDTPEHSDTVTASPQWGRFATYAALDEADGDTPEHSDTVTALFPGVEFATDGDSAPLADEHLTTSESEEVPTTTGTPLRRKRRASLAATNKPSKMYKVKLTQIGYIQFLRYMVDVPDLDEFSFCLWLRPRNLTTNQPIFSYSRKERERLARAWVSPGSPPQLHLRVLEADVPPEPVPLPAHAHAHRARWLHLCVSWDGRAGRYGMYVDGRLHAGGVRPELAGTVLPGGGDVVVGQEYTDFDKGLDDGIEGEVFGFYLFRSSGQGQAGDEVPRRVRRLYTMCTQPLPLPHTLVSWPTTPVRIFGGAIVANIREQCGLF